MTMLNLAGLLIETVYLLFLLTLFVVTILWTRIVYIVMRTERSVFNMIIICSSVSHFLVYLLIVMYFLGGALVRSSMFLIFWAFTIGLLIATVLAILKSNTHDASTAI